MQSLNYADTARALLAESRPLPDDVYLGDTLQPCNGSNHVSDDNLRLIKLPDLLNCKMRMRPVVAYVTFRNDDVAFRVSLDVSRMWYNFTAFLPNVKPLHLGSIRTRENARAAGVAALFRDADAGNAFLSGIKTPEEEGEAARIMQEQAALRALRATKKLEMEARKAKQTRKKFVSD